MCCLSSLAPSWQVSSDTEWQPPVSLLECGERSQNEMEGGGEWFHYYAIACCCCEEALILKFHPFYSWLSTMDTLLLGKGLRASTSGSLGPGWNPAQRIPGVCPSSRGEVCLDGPVHCGTLFPFILPCPSLPFFLSLLCTLPHSFPSLFWNKTYTWQNAHIQCTPQWVIPVCHHQSAPFL